MQLLVKGDAVVLTHAVKTLPRRGGSRRRGREICNSPPSTDPTNIQLHLEQVPPKGTRELDEHLINEGSKDHTETGRRNKDTLLPKISLSVQ